MRTCLIRFLHWWRTNAASWFQGPGKEDDMAKLIEFYVPISFQPPKTRWTPVELRGKVIEFPIARTRRSA
jgi:hypothetical protein